MSAKTKAASVSKVVLISRHAKKTRKVGEKWQKAIQRSSKELKEQKII